MGIESAYRAAEREIRSELLAINLSDFNEAQAQRIQTRTRSIIAALHVAADNWTQGELMREYRKGARRARTALEILGKKPVKNPFTAPEIGVRDDAFAVLYKANISIMQTVSRYVALALHASKAIKGIQAQEFNFNDIQGEIDEIAEEANVAGTPGSRLSVIKHRTGLPGKIAAVLRDQILEGGFIEINGRQWQLSKYIKMVVRTEQRKAATKATVDLCDQYGNDLVEVSDHGTTCEICQEIEGNVYSLSGVHPKYPAMPIDFPPHPNCEHSILPTSEEAIDIRREYA